MMHRSGLSVVQFDLLRIEVVLQLFDYLHQFAAATFVVAVVHRGNTQCPNQTIEIRSRAWSH